MISIKKKSPLLPLPNFLIIGAQKSGTTFLYNLLKNQKYITMYEPKEVHFFDLHPNENLDWYRSHYPYKKSKENEIAVGEASPYYFFHPHVPKRVSEVIPNAKFILLLRNPVDRAFSMYQQQKRNNIEVASTFEIAISMEEERLKEEIWNMKSNSSYRSFNHQKFSYLSRGIYYNQLLNWLSFFKLEQFHILKSEDFFMKPKKSFSAILNFLNCKENSIRLDLLQKNKGQYDSKINIKTRKKLEDFFAPHNQNLYKLINQNYGW